MLNQVYLLAAENHASRPAVFFIGDQKAVKINDTIIIASSGKFLFWKRKLFFQIFLHQIPLPTSPTTCST